HTISLLTMTVVISTAIAATPTPWERYLLQPTSANARLVDRIAYSESGVSPADIERDLQLLAIQVISSDAEAVGLAFRLRARADGHVGEALDIMVGRLIRVNPRLFLTVLDSQAGPIERLDSLVANFGDEFVDREAAQQYEASRRQTALLTVTDR